MDAGDTINIQRLFETMMTRMESNTSLMRDEISKLSTRIEEVSLKQELSANSPLVQQ